MAQQISCDICQQEVAVQMLTNLQDGSVLAMGPACLPTFYGQSVLMVMGAGGHSGPAGKCQACRRVHERMTTPPAPPGDVSHETPQPDDGWSGNQSAGALGPEQIRQVEEADRPAPSPEAGVQ